MQKLIIIGVTSALAGAVGFALGYRFCDKRMLAIYDEQLDDEIAKLRQHYKLLNKTDEFSTPESTMEHLHPETRVVIDEETVQRIARGLQKMDYTKVKPSLEEAGNFFLKPKEKPVEVVSMTLESPLPAEEPEEPEDPDGPYAIDANTFFENQAGYKNISLTWFNGDKVLMDENDGVVETVSTNIGNHNLKKFGHLSGDANVVYVRNEHLQVDFEILLSQEKYSEVVLGQE